MVKISGSKQMQLLSEKLKNVTSKNSRTKFDKDANKQRKMMKINPLSLLVIVRDYLDIVGDFLKVTLYYCCYYY